MLPGIIHNPQHNVFTHQVKANVNNLSFGMAADGSAPTYLPNLTKAIDLHLHINPGVLVGSASFGVGFTVIPSLYFRLPAGSRIYITNRGTIWGGGGHGGQGDRGKRTDETQSPFVGGGGGGGAGPGSVGGSVATDDPTGGSFSPNPTAGSGAIAGSTTGGAAGVQDPNEVPGASDGGYTRGYSPQKGGNAITVSNAGALTIYIDNAGGLIYAGATGGEGGYQTGSLSGGNTEDPLPGENTPTSMTSTVNSALPCALSYAAIQTLVWVANGVYPSVRGPVNTTT